MLYLVNVHFTWFINKLINISLGGGGGLCDINMASYLLIFRGQVKQKFCSVNMIYFSYQIYGGSRVDGLGDNALCTCNTRQ